MEKKTIVARAEVQKGKEQEFIQKTENLIKSTRKEDGNISYHLYQSPEDPARFIFYEEYKNDEAINAHSASEHFNAFAKSIENILAKELIIETF